jgi:hypothetical protein
VPHVSDHSGCVYVCFMGSDDKWRYHVSGQLCFFVYITGRTCNHNLKNTYYFQTKEIVYRRGAENRVVLLYMFTSVVTSPPLHHFFVFVSHVAVRNLSLRWNLQAVVLTERTARYRKQVCRNDLLLVTVHYEEVLIMEYQYAYLLPIHVFAK